ncbi:hypothetical protein [Macellibacteroides fermentans]|uniref:hypothetical protein n=1 Tax=Macellibacteroides fermentans TaxID=879969 RepID=UPI00352C5D7B
MNNRLKILTTFILTLVVAVGGGYLYYSMITDLQQSDEEYITGVYYEQPVVIPRVNMGNVNPNKVRRSAERFQSGANLPDTKTKLPSEIAVGSAGSSSSGTLSGFGGYSYRKKAAESSYSGTGGFAGGMIAYGGGSRSGGDNASGSYGGTTMGGTSSLLVPRTKPTTPPTTGGGIILVDPGTYTTPGEEVGNPIPVGEGWWILMLLALGYGAIKSPFATRRRVRSEE